MSTVRPAYVAGRWEKTPDVLPIRSPFDGTVVAEVCQCGPAEMERALAGAHAAFDKTKRLATYERAAICRDIASRIGGRKEELALSMVLEGGKPMSDALGEVDRAVHCFEEAASVVEHLGGEMMPLDLRAHSARRMGITRRVPIGPISAISPFNFPVNLAVHKLAPAIGAGCPIVLKPAPQTPTACLLLAEIIDQSAWPKGALSVTPASPQHADVLVTDPRMKLLSFTGSPQVGWALKARAGKKKVVLELGSNSAVIVDRTADLDMAIPRIVYGAYSYAGQKCISVQRIYVHAEIQDEFTKRFVAASREVRSGDPRDPAVINGPLIDEGHGRRIESWIEEARAAGAKILLGGPRQGNVLPPTVLEGVPPTCKLSAEEAFAPVVTIDSFTDMKRALAAVDDSAFGLQAGIFTADLHHALAAWEELEVGGVIVNDIPSWRIDPMPYGGVKDSGLGREGIRVSMEEMTEVRMLVINQRPRG
jgi:glyceraldehyde-3-phosphate dehydrogenase (NADP+)